MDLNRFLFSSLFNTFFFSFSFIFTFCWPLSRMFCFFCLLVVFVTLLCMRSESGCPLKNCCKSSAPKQNKHKESNKKKELKRLHNKKMNKNYQNSEWNIWCLIWCQRLFRRFVVFVYPSSFSSSFSPFAKRHIFHTHGLYNMPLLLS